MVGKVDGSPIGSVGCVGVDGEQVGDATPQSVVDHCILVSVEVVLILAESGIDQVPLIRREELTDGQEVGAVGHLCFLNYGKSTGWVRAIATGFVPVRQLVSGVAEDPTGPVADCIGAGQNGFPVLIGPLAGINGDLSGQDQQNSGVLGQGQEQFQELGDHQERGQNQKGKAGHGFSVPGACEESSTDQHGQCRASPPKAQQGARTARRLVFLLDRTVAEAPSWPHRGLWPPWAFNSLHFAPGPLRSPR